ncbi:MAG: tyrosine-type recombinase/integrase [Candidatus Bathyarchaeia archaeon]
MAHYLVRYRSGSPKTLYVNVDAIARYSDRIKITPDDLISDVKNQDGIVELGKIPKHVKALEDYVAELQDKGLADSRIANYVKAIRSLYRENDVEIKLPHALRRGSVRTDRAPRPEELQRLLDVTGLREKVIITMLALGGFREGTLVRLQYGHVKEDLEKGIVPIHLHIRRQITKGKYHEYDTFLGEEAVEYLRLYLDARQKGSMDGDIPPETLSDDSCLIRDSRSQLVKPIGERQIYQLIHALFFKAGLIKPGQNGGYDLRVHSLRKYFMTQLMALGVQSDYVDYMMGHTISTYHDIQSKGIEFLRNIYARSDLRIKPKPSISKNEVVIQAIRGMLSPRQLQRVEEALAEPETKYLDPEERQREEIRALSQALRQSLKNELLLNR